MKFLIHSNGPTIPTGYGVQARHLATRLAADGHEVAISCTYGSQGPITTWTSPLGHQVRVYPSGYREQSNDVIVAHAEHWFEGDKTAGWIIPLMDVWGLVNPFLDEFQVAAWAPVDHFPAPADVLKFFHRTGATPVAMSRFGERQFFEAGLDPVYVPLAVDTAAYRPTFTVDVAGTKVSARELFKVPQDAFVVGMVAMNKDTMDRKNFHGAFRAFGQFWQNHQNAVLLVHSDRSGSAGGFDLVTLAQHCGVPDHALIWTDSYAYRLGLPSEMMAALYTSMDVLLAPSRGEGFCVPMIEAQACGTPVIAADFSAQSELVGPGWLVSGQPEWDPTQRASYICPSIPDIVARLEDAYAADLVEVGMRSVMFAQQYDWDHVYETFWRPFVASLEPAPLVVKPKMERVDVIVPAMREANRVRFFKSLLKSGTGSDVVRIGETLTDAFAKPERTYAENVNRLVADTESDWVLVVGDDVEFTPGWFEAAQAISDRYDVIGTNDSEPGRVRNPEVAAGRHADHFFVRRSYIEDEGGSLDGPGTLMPTCYRHWFVDKEVIGLAKARGVFGMAMDSVIVHHHPGYDGDEAARAADPTYMAAVDGSEADRKTFMRRSPLIEGHRVGRGK